MSTNSGPVTIKGVCFDPARRVLLCRNDRDEWELPGGRPEPGEAFADCLAREVREEASLVASVGALLDAFPFEVLSGRWVNVIVYVCQIAADQTPVVSHEHQRVALFDSDDLPTMRLPAQYLRAIDLGLRTRSSSGQP